MAPNPVRMAIHARLVADIPLAALVADRVYFQQAPQDATYPLVVFFKSSGTPRWSFAGDPARADLWTVKGIATGASSASKAEDIDAAIEAALRDAPLAITGRDLLLKPLRESDVDFPEDDGGTLYRHAGGTYRLVTE